MWATWTASPSASFRTREDESVVADADGNSSAIDQAIQSDQRPPTPHLSISKRPFWTAARGHLLFCRHRSTRRTTRWASPMHHSTRCSRRRLQHGKRYPPNPRRMRSKPGMPLSGTTTTRGNMLSWPTSSRASGRSNKLPTVPRRLRVSEARCGVFDQATAKDRPWAMVEWGRW